MLPYKTHTSYSINAQNVKDCELKMASRKLWQVLVSAPARVGTPTLLSAPLKTSKIGKHPEALKKETRYCMFYSGLKQIKVNYIKYKSQSY